MTDVAALCVAYVDLIVRVTPEERAAAGLAGGEMRGLDVAHMKQVFEDYRPRGRIICGGPAANTIAGVAALGGKAAFIGKTADDSGGRIFREEYRRNGVSFTCDPAGEGTACCVIFVTPDGERSLYYNMGVSLDIMPPDAECSKTALADARILYIGHPARHEGCFPAIAAARKLAPNAKTAATLQNYEYHPHEAPVFLRHAFDFDIIMGNESEYAAFVRDTNHKTLEDLAHAHPGMIFARTLAEKGAEVYAGETVVRVPAHRPAVVRDATGAGDAWAAGFLYGLSRDFPLERAARLASACAAHILDEDGGRPTRSWRDLIPLTGEAA